MKWYILGQDYLNYINAWNQCSIYTDAGFKCKVKSLNNGKFQVLIYE